jgi:acyl-CoA reductase-like NAD-dependent aldehyde dehydrogenase
VVNIDWVRRAQTVTPAVTAFINGRRQTEPGGEQLDKYGPRDGKLLCRFSVSPANVIEQAIANGKTAFEDGRWSRAPIQRRKQVLYRLAALIDEHREELALLECLDVGKPISDALNFDVPASAATLRFNAEAADKFYGKVYAADQSSLSYELHRPVGVVAGIVGWNFPLLLAAGKIGPALATGNSLVLKPSELTSLSATRVAELAVQAGLPEGVFNVIHGGPAVGAALAEHRDVSVVTFTGSSRSGKKVMIAAGNSNLKKVILECGGKAPNIVFDDSPGLEAVAGAVVTRAFRNQGEVCTASSRLLIQENIKEEFLRIVVSKIAMLQPGDPLRSETTFGALVSQGHKKKILDYVSDALTEGAHLAYEGHAAVPHEGGFYVSPIVFDKVSSMQRIAQEEIFGPVLSVITFRDEAEAIKIANDTIYGLSAILWTKNLGRAHRVSQAINAGWVVVNGTDIPSGGPGVAVLPIGGHKESGVGTEGGMEGLEEYTSKTTVQYFV